MEHGPSLTLSRATGYPRCGLLIGVVCPSLFSYSKLAQNNNRHSRRSIVPDPNLTLPTIADVLRSGISDHERVKFRCAQA